jgi:hypothetical protein
VTTTIDPDLPPCPECKAGKHGNCNGQTWNPKADAPDICPFGGTEHYGLIQL